MSDFDRRWDAAFRKVVLAVPMFLVVAAIGASLVFFLVDSIAAIPVFFGIAILPAIAAVTLLWVDIAFNPRWRP